MSDVHPCDFGDAHDSFAAACDGLGQVIDWALKGEGVPALIISLDYAGRALDREVAEGVLRVVYAALQDERLHLATHPDEVRSVSVRTVQDEADYFASLLE